MKRLSFILLLLVSLKCEGQIADWHNHITAKHFVNDVDDADSVSYFMKKDGRLPQRYQTAWKQVGGHIDKDEDSHYGNYFQSTYTDLQRGGYKIVVQSISPLEPNSFHDRSWIFRKLAAQKAYKASGMQKLRFNTLIHTPSWTEAYNEYLYTVNQNTTSEDGTYHLLFPKNRQELEEDIVKPNTCVGIISFEGGHILFGDTLFNEDGFMRSTLTPEAKREVLRNLDILKNHMDHRVFFMTFSHIFWNTLAGHAKALDKKAERKSLYTMSKYEFLRKKTTTKYGSGLPPKINWNADETIPGEFDCNCPKDMVRVDNACYEGTRVDNFGKELICDILNIDNKWGKPIYIDVKHMDVRSRLDYYFLRDSLVKARGVPIPIIYSHGAASGENLKVAYHTSVSPMMDIYSEALDPVQFYKEYYVDFPQYNCGLFHDFKSNPQTKDWFKVNFIKSGDTSYNDPFISKDDLKLADKNTVGWFYSWSINLFDEEIPLIYNSDGVIGVMAEERTLGWYLPKYHDDGYAKWLRDTLTIENLKARVGEKLFEGVGIDTSLVLDSFIKAEPFLRNVFYIVKHSGRNDSTAWEHIAFGSDFDGFINPIDICETSAEVPGFKQYLRKIIPYFLKIHPEYQIGDQCDGLFYKLSIESALNKLFYTNTERLIRKYF